MGYASAATSDPPEAVIAGRYRVERRLGEGGMAQVYAVVDVGTGKRLALKRLAFDATPSMAALFEREYQTLAGLKHPSIVEVYDYGSDAQGPYYSMELIEGGDLSKAAPMPWRKACSVLRDAASLLGLLHARHLLHRDLSPRNFLRAPDGRLKLIDFGALASFGTTTEVVGTPPFVPPEALHKAPLDQRTDVFGLGALAYWLLTGSHAFAARSLGELPGVWQRAPASPSDLLGLLGSEELEPVPQELDALVMSMLRLDPAERLQTTAELIDRLNALADLTPESEALAVQGYLDSKAFVGRARERERALALLRTANEGRVQTLLIEGDPGVGRTRFMHELVVSARVAGALAVVIDDGRATRAYGAASALLQNLLQVLPEPAREALMPDAALLGAVSPELGALLGGSRKLEVLPGHGELRLAVLAAMKRAILALSRDRLLALFVDDVREIDEESQALLAALAASDAGHRLMLNLTLTRESKKDLSGAIESLRTSGSRLRLLPLTAGELLELLRSVFGQVPYLERLSERLHRASDGNPAYCLELAQRLVHTGAATYREGAWALPPELSQGSLPENRRAAQVARLDQLSAEARALACRLSIPHDVVFSFEYCFAASALPKAKLHELVFELRRERVLLAAASGYRFAQVDVQRALYEELSEADRVEAHRRVAEAMVAAANDAHSMLRTALHFFHAGEVRRGHAMMQRVADLLQTGDLRWVSGVATLFEEVHAQLCRLGQDDYGKFGVLCCLAMCGFFAERRYAEQYGDLAIATGERVLRLSLARRLSRFLGGKLGLIVALVIAGIALSRRKDRAPAPGEAIRLFIANVTALAGTALICVDAERTERYAELLRPFSLLGRNHVANVIYEFVANMVPYQRDRLTEGARMMKEYVDKLSTGTPVRDLTEDMRRTYVAGTLMSIGVLESWCDSDQCLATADRLEQFSPLHAMSADHIRASYHSSQGDSELSEYYRKRVEMHAVQLGSAWQVDMWASAEGIKVGLRTNDATVLKRTVQELNRLSRELPSFLDVERAAHGAYLLLRGKPAEAIPLLEPSDSTKRLGRVRTMGCLAAAHNALGQHEKAREVCLQALEGQDPEDSKYVVMTLDAHIQLALAEAGLHQFETATKRLDALLAQHAPGRSAITLGSLHHARARVGLRKSNFDEAREHLAKMEGYYRATRVATLMELIPALRREIDRAENPLAAAQEIEDLRERGEHVMMRVRWLLSQSDDSRLINRARKGLRLALELTHADEGFLVLAGHEGEHVAHLGNVAPSSELLSWAEQSMLEAGVDEQTLMTAEVDSDIASNYKVVDNTRFCVVPLWGVNEQQQSAVAALVLGFENRVPQMPEPTVMRAIAVHLATQRADEQSVTPRG